jgi:iron complex transport system substrate-binding protein
VCIEWIEPLMLAANWMPEMLEIAGAAVGVTRGGGPSRCHSWSDVIEFRPEVVIIMPCGFDASRAAAEAAVLTRRPGWSDLPAVLRGRVFAVDGNAYFNRAGPRIVESVELLAHLLHPERFPRSDLPREIAPAGAFICLTTGSE